MLICEPRLSSLDGDREHIFLGCITCKFEMNLGTKPTPAEVTMANFVHNKTVMEGIKDV